MKYPYFKFPLNQRSEYFGTSTLKPIIPVTIINNGEKIRYDALVDSGADFNIFHAEIGEGIGIDVISGEPIAFGGIQAMTGAQGYFHEVELEIGGHRFTSRAVFSYDIAKHGHGVLGQKGFFEFFKVLFEYKKDRIEINPR